MSKAGTSNEPRSRVTSIEFQLTVECCRQAFAGGDARRIQALGASVDWSRFARVARYHRVQGLVWNSLRRAEAKVPVDVANALSADMMSIAAANLRASVEAEQLCRRLERAGVPAMFVKGLTVGALAYPKPLLKMGWDIDILIGEEDVAPAAAALAAHGYQPTIPAATANLAGWHNRHKESVWARPEQGLYVELHTRLADNRSLIPSIGINSPRRNVELESGMSLPTLADDELFAYLCVHGASSLWFRLKWITDLAAILHRVLPQQIERLYDRSRQLGAGRASAQALLHADDLYGTLAETGLRAALERDRGSRWLAALAMRQAAGREEPREPTSVPLGTASIHLSQLLLLPGYRFKLGELGRQMRDILLP